MLRDIHLKVSTQIHVNCPVLSHYHLLNQRNKRSKMTAISSMLIKCHVPSSAHFLERMKIFSIFQLHFKTWHDRWFMLTIIDLGTVKSYRRWRATMFMREGKKLHKRSFPRKLSNVQLKFERIVENCLWSKKFSENILSIFRIISNI